MPSPPPLATAVVGAGPAGLLFCFIARLIEPDPAVWPIVLVDKRPEYARTHRLRMDPEPYRRIQHDLANPRYDGFMKYLQVEEFRPAANDLEGHLADAVAELGIFRRQLTVGDGPGEASLAELRAGVVSDIPGGETTAFSVVGSDSVKSTVRRLVGADSGLVIQRHQSVARLKLEGAGLPQRLGRAEQFKMAKLLGSVLDYRLNPNGFAEVDLFLAAEEHDRVTQLGAAPAEPIMLSNEVLSELGAPLFATIVGHLADHVGEGRLKAALQSTFRLEHQYSPQVAFDHDAGSVFLVGDAAISLPFFRGMASLAANVAALVAAHQSIIGGTAVAAAAQAYDASAAAVAEREIAVVRNRNRMVQAAREVVRISAAVPFPIQAWFLSVADAEKGPAKMSLGVMVNAALAVIAAAIAIAAPLLGGYVAAPLGWVWLAALPVEAAGGYAFETARRLETRPNRLLSVVWQIQLAILIVAGIPLTVLASRALGRPAQLYALVAWFVLGIAFVVGMRAATARYNDPV